MDATLLIVNYNGKILLEKLLPALHKNWLCRTSYTLEVVVVDNASTDDSVDYLHSLDYIRLVCSSGNLGFAAGNNLVLNDLESRYVFLLNSDTLLPESSVHPDSLIQYMDTHDRVAILTPDVRLDSGLPDPAAHRGEPTPWASFTYLCGLERLFPRSKTFARYHQSWKSLSTIHSIDACSGAAMLVRVSAMKKTGLLDERFFMYAEDLDWCRRFREQGYDIVYFPEIRILHSKYQSGIEGSNPVVRRHFYLTMLQYFDKYYRTKYPLFRRLLKAYVRFKTRSLSD